jgi:hypothetical protein
MAKADDASATQADRNSERQAKARARVEQWQTTANPIWKRHPGWGPTAVAKRVEADLKLKPGTWDIIRKKIEKK